MARKIARVLLTIVGAAVGPALVVLINRMFEYFGFLGMQQILLEWGMVLIYVASGLVTAIITFIFSPKLIESFLQSMKRAESKLAEYSLSEIFVGVIGLLVGLLIAFLASTLTSSLKTTLLRFFINVCFYVVFGYLGWSIAAKRRAEVNMPGWFKRREKGLDKGENTAKPKILDTSVIIDGRIADICETGVIEGSLVVPGFVLQELRHIADSSDALKRNRGRRGLDILKRMQEELQLPVRVVEIDYDDIAEVDAKLIRLAYELSGVVVTNDFNLNKVAGVQGVPVLNINEMANAIKPVVLPGEEMTVTVIKDGKEQGQGVAYLDDGTMIVVDGGKRYMGESCDVLVTSVLQTAAGRMIFAKLK